MKVFLMTTLAMALTSASLIAADTAKPAVMDPKQEEMMKAWKELSTPGEAHKMLTDMAGKWKFTTTMWHKPDAAPETSEGSSVMKPILGGRFLQQEVKGKSMGQDFEGMGITGYDNIKKKYDTIWLDSMSTAVMHGMGSYDATTATLTDKGEMTCPMSKNKTRTFRSEWKMIDKNNMVFAMYTPDEKKKEFKMMEIVYKRK